MNVDARRLLIPSSRPAMWPTQTDCEITQYLEFIHLQKITYFIVFVANDFLPSLDTPFMFKNESIVLFFICS